MTGPRDVFRARRIEIRGFRCLADVALNLRGLNVLLGPNGAGKTSFLDVFELLSRGARQELSKALSQRGGLGSLLTVPLAGEKPVAGAGIDLTLEGPGKEPAGIYQVELRSSGPVGYQIAAESLTRLGPQKSKQKDSVWIDSRPGRHLLHDGKSLVTPSWEYEESELALAQVPKSFSTSERVRACLASACTYGPLDVGPRAPIRAPQDLDPLPLLPEPNGEALVPALYNLRTHHEDRFARVVEALRAGFPGFRSLDFPLVTAGKATPPVEGRTGVPGLPGPRALRRNASLPLARRAPPLAGSAAPRAPGRAGGVAPPRAPQAPGGSVPGGGGRDLPALRRHPVRPPAPVARFPETTGHYGKRMSTERRQERKERKALSQVRGTTGLN